MTPARLLSLLAALLFLAGCSESEDEARERCARVSSQRLIQPVPPLLTVGTPASVKIVADSLPRCLKRLEPELAPDTVTAEVYGPGNTRIPSDIALNPEDDNPWTATLRFTPEVSGAYLAVVSFAPVGGLQQQVFLVGMDRTQQPVAAELPRDMCFHVDRTSRGTWICDGAARRPGAQDWQVLGNGAKVAVAGDVLWVVDPWRVQRFVDTGSSLELTATLSFQTVVSNTFSRLATADELVLLDERYVYRITFSPEQGLTAWPTFRLPPHEAMPFGADDVLGLLVRSGEALLWVYLDRTTSLTSRVCPLRLGAEGGFVLAEAPCQTLSGVPVGSELDVLWTGTFTPVLVGGDVRFFQGTVHYWRVRDGRLVEEAVLSLGNHASPNRDGVLGAGPSVPVLFHGEMQPVLLPLWSAEQGRLELEMLSGWNTDTPRASPRFLWTRRGGTVKVIAR